MSVHTPNKVLKIRTWQERLGGPFAISRKSFVISSTLALLFFAQLESFGTQSFEIVWRWVQIYCCATAVLAVINIGLHKTLYAQRFTKPVSVNIALATHGLQGLLFSSIMVSGAKILDIEQKFNSILLVVLMTGVALWWGSTLTVFRDHQHENRENRKSLIEKAIAAESLSQSQKQSSQALDELFSTDVASELSSVEKQLERNRDQDNWSASSALLMNAATKQVRTISHDLMATTPLPYPRIRWWSLGRNIINYQPINIGLTSVVILVTGVPQLTELLGVKRAFTLLTIVVALVIVIGLTANKLMKSFPRYHALIFIGAFLLMQISIPINVHFRELWQPGISSLGWQLTQLVLGFILILLSSGFGAWSNINERLNMNLQEDLKERHIQAIASSRQIAERAREASKVLHGAVQTKLVACALAIDQAAVTGDEETIREAIDHALVVLKTPLAKEDVRSSILEEVQRKASLWSEICNINLDISDSRLPSDPSKVLLIGRVIEEGISNAIRHGRAKNITVSINVDENRAIDIHVIDDGTGPKNGKPSLGSALLNQASNGSWSLTSTDKGADLHLQIRG